MERGSFGRVRWPVEHMISSCGVLTGERGRTVKAVATVSSLPSTTYTANETVETNTGASDHGAWNMTEFKRAVIEHEQVFTHRRRQHMYL